MKYSDEMNRIQDAMLITTEIFRNCIQKIFFDYASENSLVDNTLKRLVSYFSERSQTVSHLASIEYLWDAEIIYRSAVETSAKIWFICLSSVEDREVLVEEFWNINSKIHNRKSSNQAKKVYELFLFRKAEDETDIFYHLQDEKIFPYDDGNRKERKVAEQKWSFSEIITYLENNYPREVPCKYLSSFMYHYGMSSHLIHADEIALDLMLDSQLRDKEELLIFKCAQCTKLWCNLVSLWFFLIQTLYFKYEVCDKDEGINSIYKGFCDLCKPVENRFYDSQRNFYDEYKKNNR